MRTHAQERGRGKIKAHNKTPDRETTKDDTRDTRTREGGGGALARTRTRDNAVSLARGQKKRGDCA